MTELLLPRRFILRRNADVTGVSGTGDIADGVLWPDGTVTLRWRGQYASLVHWQSLDHVERIHGHDGATVVVWLDAMTSERYRVGTHQARNIYRVNPLGDATTDEPVAVTFDPAFGPVVVAALNAQAA